MSPMTVVIRAAGDARALQNAVRGVVQSLDKNAPVYRTYLALVFADAVLDGGDTPTLL